MTTSTRTATRSRVAVLLSAVTVSLLALAGAPALAATDNGVGIRLVDAPVDRKDDPRASLYVVDHVAPGTSFTRRVEVVGPADRAVDLKVYAAAADVEGNGFTIVEGRSSNELTDWTTVTPAQVSLKPGTRATVTVKVDVPAGASSGERYAAVVAELPPVRTPGSQVAVASRVGVRMYLSVGAGGEPASDFTVSTLTPQRLDDQTPVVTAQVENTGGRALDMSGELTLSKGPGGLSAGPFPVDVRTIGVGQRADVAVKLDKALPAGPWAARLVMRSGRVEKASEAVLTFPAPGTTGAPVAAKDVPLAKDPSVVIPVAVGLLVLVALLLLLVLWRRRRKDRDDDAPGGPASVPAPRTGEQPTRVRG